MALIDLRNCVITLRDGDSHYLEIHIGQGNLTYSEKRQVELLKSRGKLDTVRENEDEGMEVAFAFMWEFLKSDSSDPSGMIPSIEEALKKEGAASGWVSASSDTLAPYMVNIEVLHTPPCSGIKKETVLLPKFNSQDLAHSLLDATVACKGICNARVATVTRS